MTAGPPAEFGFSRWGAEIVRLAEPISTRSPNQLAPRARSVARNGGVTLTVDGRSVSGLVQRGGEASVAHLEFGPMTSATASALRELLGASTEPTDDMYHRLVEAAAWSPAGLDVADCSCRARGDRCLHILATLYALAAAVDREPALALRLRDFEGSLDGSSVDAAPDPDAPSSRIPPRWSALTAFDVRDYWQSGPRADLPR
ncbi:SWIM zinc finger family protein [Gordonia sp. HS-NH1]|uniref:SWIM zinc finger family protein n=1 Tax=Gordonia sp. HS-NH1 TaxID=1435068 RepID=UPI0006E2498B|nr:SWIM zinc finger family protein [Gordonia sp. HS-NH1]